jgi:deoxyribose-phosphate aldolase
MTLVHAAVAKSLKLVTEKQLDFSLMEKINAFIEHTCLKSTTTKEDVERLCNEALEHGFFGVCVPPYFVKQAARKFKAAKAVQKVISVAGFPLGHAPVSAKVEEVKKSIADGAHELDVMVNLSAYLSGDLSVVKNDIQSVVTVCHLQNRPVKIILETGILSEEQILELADICAGAGADFVKTSTGYIPQGASAEAVRLLRAHLPDKIKIKASGGIQHPDTVRELIGAGAERIGTSSGIHIIQRL